MSSGPTGTVSIGGQTASAANHDVSGGATRYVPVSVNLQAVIDISGNVEIFTIPSTTVENVVICSERLLSSVLYVEGSGGVFEFTEPSGGRSDVSGYLSDGQNGAALNGISNMGLDTERGSGLQSCLTHSLDASGANPFHRYAGQANGAYTNYTSLGELVLSLYAAYIFGHPAATAGITNDEALVNYINDSSNSGAAVGSHLDSAIRSLDNGVATSIVRTVLSQDPSRAVNVPNRMYNTTSGQYHVPLIFVPGDIIYVSIKVQAPSVSTVNSSGARGATGGNLVGVAANAGSNYPNPAPTLAFQITLSGDALAVVA